MKLKGNMPVVQPGLAPVRGQDNAPIGAVDNATVHNEEQLQNAILSTSYEGSVISFGSPIHITRPIVVPPGKNGIIFRCNRQPITLDSSVGIVWDIKSSFNIFLDLTVGADDNTVYTATCFSFDSSANYNMVRRAGMRCTIAGADAGTKNIISDSFKVTAVGNTPTFISLYDAGWNDIVTDFIVRSTGPTKPSYANVFGGIYCYLWAAGSTTEVQDEAHVLHDYAPGTKMYPHIHWMPTTANAGTVRWGIEYTVAKGHSQMAFNTTTTTVYVEQAAGGTAWTHHVAEVSDANAIPSTNLEPDTVILFRVFRDGSHAKDTYPDDVAAWQIDMHYQTDRLATKHREPDFYDD